MNFLNFIPSIISLFLALLTLPLLYLPGTEQERKLWERLNIRTLRHWATKQGTEKWAEKSVIQNSLGRSRKNIIWHGLITLVFFLLMLRAQFIDNKVIQYGSHVFIVPSIVYFIGSIIQRQKLIIVLTVKKKY